MKLIAAADIHQMDRTPVGRTDASFTTTELGKLEWVVDQCDLNNAALLISGDIFDKAITPIWLVAEVAAILRKVPGNQVYFVPGQHDLPYHVEAHYKNSSLSLLEHWGVAQRVYAEKPVELANKVMLHGAGWGEPLPAISEEFEDCVNILVTHRMIIKDKRLWHAQTGYSKAAGLLRRNKSLDIIISGDNHQSFSVKYKGRFLINPGSMLRLTRAQVDHDPKVFLIDTEEMNFLPLFIPFKHESLDADTIPDTSTTSADLKKYVAELTESRADNTRVDFMDHVRKALTSRRVKKNIKTGLKAIMEACNVE